VAQAKTVAGDKTATVASANVDQQCLHAGLLDEVVVSLVPVLLGEGIRIFDHLKDTTITCGAFLDEQALPGGRPCRCRTPRQGVGRPQGAARRRKAPVNHVVGHTFDQLPRPQR
jgi:hypothetical protein